MLASTRRRSPKGSFRIVGLSPEETQHWQAKLSNLQSECGCTMGTAFLLLSGIVYVVVLAMRPGNGANSWWLVLGEGILVVIFGALLGKALGIRMARWKLKRDIARLKRRGAIVISEVPRPFGHAQETGN